METGQPSINQRLALKNPPPRSNLLHNNHHNHPLPHRVKKHDRLNRLDNKFGTTPFALDQVAAVQIIIKSNIIFTDLAPD